MKIIDYRATTAILLFLLALLFSLPMCIFNRHSENNRQSNK